MILQIFLICKSTYVSSIFFMWVWTHLLEDDSYVSRIYFYKYIQSWLSPKFKKTTVSMHLL